MPTPRVLSLLALLAACDRPEKVWSAAVPLQEHKPSLRFDDVLVVVSATDWRHPAAVAIDVTTGRERWRSTQDAGDIVLPTRPDEPVLLVTYAPSLVSLDARTGKELRVVPLAPADNPERTSWSRAPDGSLLVQGAESLARIDAATGEALWRVPNTVELGLTPALSGDVALFDCGELSASDNDLCRVSLATGDLTREPRNTSGFVADRDGFIVLEDTRLVAESPTGVQRWSQAFAPGFRAVATFGKPTVSDTDAAVLTRRCRSAYDCDYSLDVYLLSDGSPRDHLATGGGPGLEFYEPLILAGDILIYGGNDGGAGLQAHRIGQTGRDRRLVPLESKFVLSTDLVGSFVRGPSFTRLDPPWLFLCIQGELQGWRLPRTLTR